MGIEKVHGKELSYNNINDMQAGCLLADEINMPCVFIIKHANPCGVSKNNNLLEAYKNAFKCDPISAFGGIIIINGNIDIKLFENTHFHRANFIYLTKKNYELISQYYQTSFFKLKNFDPL